MCSGVDVAENITAATALVREVVAEGARFVATPEMTHLLQKDPVALREGVRSMEDDAGVAAFSTLAAELSIHLLIGSLAILAQGGHHADGRKTWGRSLIVAPWGEVVGKLDNDEPGFICTDIKREKVEQARARIPAWRGGAL